MERKEKNKWNVINKEEKKVKRRNSFLNKYVLLFIIKQMKENQSEIYVIYPIDLVKQLIKCIDIQVKMYM